MDAMVQDSVVVVTGAASGMGLVEAQIFAREGARVAVVDLDEAGAAAAARGIEAAGGRSIALRADLTNGDDIRDTVTRVEQALGPIDVLVNNAGLFDRYATSLETSRELWDRIIAINLTSVFEMTNAVLPGMIERGSGSIVNIASVAGVVAGKGGAAYTTTKHAILGYTKHVVAEYARFGVRCNAVLPGTIETPLTRDILADIPVDAVPARRFGKPEEVAELVVFLASGRAGFVNGAAVTADGGFTVQ